MTILKTFRFLAVILVSLFGVVYLLFILYVYFNQAGMIFQSSSLPKDYKFAYHQEFEELNAKSFDGKVINGLLFTAEKSKGLVFYLHGNAGTLETWGSIANVYTDLGYDIFILDYRGFGKSEGHIESETQLNKDISIFYKLLCKRYKEKDIVITGYSIGSGLASNLASKNNPGKVILQSPYYSFTELSGAMVPFFPDILKKFHMETFEDIQKIKVPIYIFHGTDDLLIPCENSIRLSEFLKENGRCFLLKNQGHIGMNENDDFKDHLRLILKIDNK